MAQNRKKKSIERKLGELKKDFILFRHNNAKKNKFNECYDKNNLLDKKIVINKVDTFAKVPPSLESL